MLPPETIRKAIEERLFGTGLVGGLIEGVSRWNASSGGLSDAAVWRVTHPMRGDYAVRRWWAGIDSRYVAWIGVTLRGAVSSGLRFVAAPIEDDDHWPYRDAESGRWEAAPWKPGDALDAMPVDDSNLHAATEGLARFHWALRSSPPGSTVVGHAFADREQRLTQMMASPPPATPLSLERWPELAPLRQRVTAAAERSLKALAPWRDLPLETQPIHGDARPEHFLMADGELTGLIDFGAMRSDTVLADLARLAGELALGDPHRRNAIVARYAQASGVSIDPEAIAALDVSGATISAGNWIRWLSEPDRRLPPAGQVRRRLTSISARLSME